MLLEKSFSTLRSLCEQEPSSAHFAQLISHVSKAWEEHPEEAHQTWLPYLRDKLASWYELCPLEIDEDYWAMQTLWRDPFAVAWQDVWVHLIDDADDVEHDDFEWPNPKLQAPSYHSWMSTIRSLALRMDDMADLDFYLFGQSLNLMPAHLSIELPNPDTIAAYNAFFSFPNFSKLTSLSWKGRAYYTESHIQTLATQLGAPIRNVQFIFACHGTTFARALCQNTACADLESLDLTHADLDDAGCVHLAEATWMRHLQELYLSENKIGDEGAIALAQSAHLSQLKVLILHDNPVGDAGIKALAQSPYLSNLEMLEVFDTRMTLEGLEALLNSPYLKPDVVQSFEVLRDRL